MCSIISVKFISDGAGGGRMSDICAPLVGVDLVKKRKRQREEQCVDTRRGLMVRGDVSGVGLGSPKR